MSRYILWNGFQAVPENLPQNLPGAYRITNLTNGKQYIGISIDVAVRCRAHSRSAVSKIGQQKRRLPKFVNALRKYGALGFLVEPVVYAVEPLKDWGDDGFWLRQLETELIVSSNAVEHGYNILESWYGGPYGEAFKAIQQETHGTTEYRKAASEKTKRDFENPARRALQSEVITGVSTRPEVVAAFTALQRALWSDQEYRARVLDARSGEEYEANRSAAIRTALAKPEIRERVRTNCWENDEVNERRSASIAAAYAAPGGKDKLLASRQDPDYLENQRQKGLARFSTEEAVQAARDAQAKVADKHSASLKAVWANNPRFWITDGVTSKQHFADLRIPRGWYRGRAGLFGRAAAKHRELSNQGVV